MSQNFEIFEYQVVGKRYKFKPKHIIPAKTAKQVKILQDTVAQGRQVR